MHNSSIGTLAHKAFGQMMGIKNVEVQKIWVSSDWQKLIYGYIKF